MAFLTTSNLKGDLFGGVTAGIVALPLALAFGIQAFGGIDDPAAAQMGALAGLVGATLLGFFAALFGGTHSQISGPTGPMTVITASIVSGAWTAAHTAGLDSAQAFGSVIIAMSLAGIFCGLFQIAFGIIRIGKYVRYIPYPVLSGFMSGIGVIIILQQLYPLIGQKSPVMVIDMILKFPTVVAQHTTGNDSATTIVAFLLGIGTIAIVQLFPKVSKKVPATLVALIVMTVVSLFIPGEFPKIGQIPSGLPMPFFAKDGISLVGLDWYTLITGALVPGLTLAGLGSIDTLLTSVVADDITKTHHNPNQELIGQGIGNALAGLFCGLAGAGATMRTVVNVKSGGRTQISGMTHALLLFAILMGLGVLVQFVPLAVLAGILITVGWGIIDFRGFKDLKKIPYADAFVLLVVFIITVFVDLLTAVGIGMVAASVLFMKRASDLAEGSYATFDGADEASPLADLDFISEETKHKIYFERFHGDIFFGSITGFNAAMHRVPAHAEIVVLRMKRVKFMDQSGVYAMETAIKELQERGVKVLMIVNHPQPRYLLSKMKVIPLVVPEEQTFGTYEECIDYLRGLNLK